MQFLEQITLKKVECTHATSYRRRAKHKSESPFQAIPNQGHEKKITRSRKSRGDPSQPPRFKFDSRALPKIPEYEKRKKALEKNK